MLDIFQAALWEIEFRIYSKSQLKVVSDFKVIIQSHYS